MRSVCILLIWSVVMAAPSTAELTTAWTRTLGGASNDGARSLVLTGDGGLVLAGYTFSSGDSCGNIYLARLDRQGATVWETVLGGPGRDYAQGICASGDGGFVYTGWSTSYGVGDEDLVIGKVDSSGNPVWQKTYGGSESDVGASVVRTNDGSFLVCGRTWSRGAGESDIYLLKADANGDSLWTRVYGGAASESGSGVCELADGSYAAFGTTGSFSANRDFFLVKVGTDGTAAWQKYYCSATNADFGNGIIAHPDGGYLMIGNGDIHGSDLEQIHFIRVDAVGTQSWDRRIGESSYYDYGCSVCPTSDGGYLIAGATKSAATRKNSLYLVKTNTDGTTRWKQVLGGATSTWGNQIAEISPGQYLIVGHTEGTGGTLDAWVIRAYDQAVADVPPAEETGRMDIAPITTPFRPGGTIRFYLPESAPACLEVFDVQGRRVSTIFSRESAVGEQTVRWTAQGLGSGVYFCSLRAGGAALTRRLLLLRR